MSQLSQTLERSCAGNNPARCANEAPGNARGGGKCGCAKVQKCGKRGRVPECPNSRLPVGGVCRVTCQTPASGTYQTGFEVWCVLHTNRLMEPTSMLSGRTGCLASTRWVGSTQLPKAATTCHSEPAQACEQTAHSKQNHQVTGLPHAPTVSERSVDAPITCSAYVFIASRSCSKDSST